MKIEHILILGALAVGGYLLYKQSQKNQPATVAATSNMASFDGKSAATGYGSAPSQAATNEWDFLSKAVGSVGSVFSNIWD